MSYTVKGNITEIYPSEEISGGKYRKQLFVVSNKDGYEGADKSYSFEIFEGSDKDRIEKFNKFNKVGDSVEVSFEVNCRENRAKPGQWFTGLSAFKVWGDKASAPAENAATLEEIPF